MELCQQGLHLPLMLRVRGANEKVVLDMQQVPQPLKVDDDLIGEGLGRFARLGGGPRDLLAVLIRPGHEKDL